MSFEAVYGLADVKKVVGAKQTAKAIEKGTAEKVFFAQDANRRIIAPVLELCERAGVPALPVPTMAELGKACGIEVGAAAVAVLKTPAKG